MTNYPAAADDGTTLPDPTATSKTNSPSHSSLHANANGAIKAIEAKLGTGASTPVANRLLFANGTGTSVWLQLTSAQLAASLSDETGSGSAVFATSPTLVTPSVNTINEATAANGVTIDGLNIKDGKLNTSSSVVTTNYTNTSVTADKLSLSPLTASVSTTETTTSTSYTDLATTTDTVTVTIGVNGLALVGITSKMYNSTNTSESFVSYAVSGASTVAAADTKGIHMLSSGVNVPQVTVSGVFLATGLTAGSNTFKMKYRVTANTGGFQNRSIWVLPL